MHHTHYNCHLLNGYLARSLVQTALFSWWDWLCKNHLLWEAQLLRTFYR